MKAWFRWPTPQDVSVGALCVLPFVLLQSIFFFVAPWSSVQMKRSDPLTQLFHATVGVWVIAALSLAVVAFWVWRYRPGVEHWRFASWRVAVGVGGAAMILLILSKATGGVMPPFIPAEESAKPGILLGLSAGVVEEVAFRLVLLPLLFFGLRTRIGPVPAMLLAIVLTGLGFAASHEIGPGAGAFRLDYFATRWIMPGAVMSLLFFAIGPAFIISAHCAAHLLIPYLFR